MNAVNLIPVEDRRGAGAPGRSGGAVYAVLGVLGMVVLVVALIALTGKQVTDKQNEAAAVTAQAQQAEAQAGSLQAYSQFSSLRDKRQQTVASLAASRFDWSHALHELARVLPDHTVITSLRATVSPSVQVEGGTSDPLRSALSVPAIELQGCTRSQDDVARLLAALRRMDGVQRVSLSSSERNEPKKAATGVPGAPGTTSAGAGASNADCRGDSTTIAQFSVTNFFTAPQTAAAPTAGATTTGTTTTSTSTTSTTAPASTTTPADSTGGTK